MKLLKAIYIHTASHIVFDTYIGLFIIARPKSPRKK